MREIISTKKKIVPLEKIKPLYKNSDKSFILLLSPLPTCILYIYDFLLSFHFLLMNSLSLRNLFVYNLKF